MYKRRKIGVVIPAYNVDGFLRSTIEGLPAFVDRIYVIDDGSSDNTASIVKTYPNPRVSLLQNKRNQGPGAAIVKGYKAAMQDKMDIVIKVDGDGQMPTDQIENLIKPIVKNEPEKSNFEYFAFNSRRSYPFLPYLR